MKQTPLTRKTPLKRTPLKARTDSSFTTKRRPVSPASKTQREKISTECCVVCGGEFVHPAHTIDRSLGGDDDPRAVVALCPEHHRAYDDGFLSIVEYLEPHYREEVAYAVMTVGIVRALERLTNQRWQPVPGQRSAA